MRSVKSASARRHALKVRGLQLGLLALILGVWAYFTGPGGVSPIFVAPIDEMLVEVVALVGDAEIWSAARTTVVEIVIALCLSLSLGFTVGFLGSRTPFRLQTFEPLLAWGYMIPFVLFYPLFLLWIGVDEGSKIAYGALNGFFPMAFNTMKGFKAVDSTLIRTARAFGASPRQIEWSVKFPAALPVVLTGVRVGAALNVITVILAEMLASRRGLGFELARSSQTLQVSRSYALILFILAIVSVLHLLIQRIGVNRGGES